MENFSITDISKSMREKIDSSYFLKNSTFSSNTFLNYLKTNSRILLAFQIIKNTVNFIIVHFYTNQFGRQKIANLQKTPPRKKHLEIHQKLPDSYKSQKSGFYPSRFSCICFAFQGQDPREIKHRQIINPPSSSRPFIYTKAMIHGKSKYRQIVHPPSSSRGHSLEPNPLPSEGVKITLYVAKSVDFRGHVGFRGCFFHRRQFIT